LKRRSPVTANRSPLPILDANVAIAAERGGATVQVFLHRVIETASDRKPYQPLASSNSFTVSTVLIRPNDGRRGDAALEAFLLDLRPRHGSDLLVILAHPPCCEANAARQAAVDAIMAFVRDAQARRGPVALVPRTPIVLMGDFNLVGSAQQLRTLVAVEIVNTPQFGPAFSPDCDGSALQDLVPRHPDQRMTYTWRSPLSAYQQRSYSAFASWYIRIDLTRRRFTPTVMTTAAMSRPAVAGGGRPPASRVCTSSGRCDA
jgi:hypothetical protein